jgi:hypothetical protein
MYKVIKSEKFHSMNATVELLRFFDGSLVERLVSYESVVCDVCLDTGTIYIYPRFQCSPTTIRQVTRFLNEYMPLENERWNIALIRELQKNVDSDGFTSLGKYGIYFQDHVIGTNLRG